MKKRSDGRYRKTIKDPRTGKTVYFYGESEREVYKKILEYTTKAEKGRTFAEVADEWWNDAYEKISPNSVKGYKPALRRAVEHFGNMRVSDITTRDVALWLRKLGNSGYAGKTVNNHKIIVSRIMQTALIDGEIPFNPTSQAEAPRGLTKNKRLPASEADEAIIRKTADVWLFPYAALMTGMRKGELLALQWRDINFEKDEISVTKSVYYDGDTPKIKTPKTASGVRVVMLLSGLKEELLKRRGKPDEYIFSENGGKTPYKEMRYDRLMKKYQAETGVSCTAHQLRKTYATIAAAANVDVKVLQSLMGHSDIRTTLDIYASVRDEAWSKARGIMEEKNREKA